MHKLRDSQNNEDLDVWPTLNGDSTTNLNSNTRVITTIDISSEQQCRP